MKYVIIIGDGMSDMPLKQLKGKTPLQAAKKPALNKLAKTGRCGLLKTVSDERFPAGSDAAHLSLLGYDLSKSYSGRAPIEAASMGINMGPNDVAFRCNLITEKDGAIIDFNAGHINSEEGAKIIRRLQKELGQMGAEFHPGVGYRHIMVLRSKWSDAIQCKPPHDIVGKQIKDNWPTATKPEGAKTSQFLRQIMERSNEILKDDPINAARTKAGKKPANMIWLWGSGKKPNLQSFKQKYGLTGSIISAVDLLKGIGRLTELSVPDVPGATGYLDTNYEGKVEAALSALEKGNFACVHIEAPDEAGHEGDVKKKIKAIEDLDAKVVAPILFALEKSGEEFAIGILPDHATPIPLKTHNRDPVPFIIYNPKTKGDNLPEYSEEACAKGSLGLREGRDFMRILLGIKD
ncbi:2,3-bisphosphoglycerate-independent phosphoglycerate mutase 1 [uncultured archaeon]|nr:2,3-bisphosphoglycerate-independent phosphoglycerate mutase 1 [uncultured archaeon]